MNEDKIGALWVKQSPKCEYMSGVIKINDEEIRIVAFKRDKKGNEKAPDWDILISKPRDEAQNTKA